MHFESYQVSPTTFVSRNRQKYVEDRLELFNYRFVKILYLLFLKIKQKHCTGQFIRIIWNY